MSDTVNTTSCWRYLKSWDPMGCGKVRFEKKLIDLCTSFQRDMVKEKLKPFVE